MAVLVAEHHVLQYFVIELKSGFPITFLPFLRIFVSFAEGVKEKATSLTVEVLRNGYSDFSTLREKLPDLFTR